METLRAFLKNPHLEPREKFVFPQQPIDVEIGAGTGWHAIQYCQKHPDRHLIAIEKTQNKFASLKGRFLRHPQLTNLSAIHANAIEWIAHNVPVKKVETYFILYPNLYPKNSQKNKRWHNMPFMDYLIETLSPQGQIILATNDLAYYNEAKKAFAGHWGMEIVEDRAIQSDEKPRSHFEKKYLARGEHCFNLVLRKGTT